MNSLNLRFGQLFAIVTTVSMMAGCLVSTSRFNPYIDARRPVVRYTQPVNPQTGEVVVMNHEPGHVIHHDGRHDETFAPPAGRPDLHADTWCPASNGVILTSESLPHEPHYVQHEYTAALPHMNDARVLKEFEPHQSASLVPDVPKPQVQPNLPRPMPTLPSTPPAPSASPTDSIATPFTLNGMTFVPLRGGTFTMGSPETEIGRASQLENETTTTVQSFSIGQTEVTRKQYWQVMEPTRRVSPADADLPLVNVSWNDAVEFSRRMSTATGRTVRLPTEAEWEYACRAGEPSLFATWEGDLAKDAKSYRDNVTRPLTRVASSLFNFDRGTGRALKPVKSYKANAWNLFDLHGNVWEWCAASTDAPHSNARPIRGGGWRSSVLDCRSANRAFESRTQARDSIGFRVVVEMTKSPATEIARSSR